MNLFENTFRTNSFCRLIFKFILANLGRLYIPIDFSKKYHTFMKRGQVIKGID